MIYAIKQSGIKYMSDDGRVAYRSLNLSGIKHCDGQYFVNIVRTICKFSTMNIPRILHLIITLIE